MINLYDSKETSFNNNGLVVLSDNISCIIEEELNGQFELELEYPLDERGKWKQLLEGNIIKADGQLFRAYHKVKTLSGIHVNCRHIFYDLLSNFLEDCRPTNLSGTGALAWILTNTQYEHPFTSMGDVGGLNTKYFVRKNPIEAIMGQDGIIANWGGELIRNNFQIELLGQRGLDRGVLVSYGKNIQGVEETLDLDNLCTRLMPVGKDGLLLIEKYIDSIYINNYSHPKIKVIELSDYETEVTLRDAAISYMTNNKIDIPQFNYKIDFLELSKTEEYKNYAVLERVFLGDTVTIKHSKLNINLKAKVIKTTKNIITDRIEKIELGSFKPNLATSINNAIQEVKQDIVQVKSDYQKAIDNATDLITGTNGGNVVIRQNAEGKPYEILIMDTTDVMTAMKCWRFNLGGLGYSSTGINGPYETAITMDGTIVGKFITALTISGEQIIGGTISGVNIKQVNGATVLADLYKDINGGKLLINDINGEPNVTIGSKIIPGAVGGTLALYYGGTNQWRVGLAVNATTHGGYMQLIDNLNVQRVAMEADNVSTGGPIIGCIGTDGVYKTWMTDKGFNGLGKISAASWSGTIPASGNMILTHNLGYKPIVRFDGTVGNVILTTMDNTVNQIRVYCYGNPWTGTVYLW